MVVLHLESFEDNLFELDFSIYKKRVSTVKPSQEGEFFCTVMKFQLSKMKGEGAPIISSTSIVMMSSSFLMFSEILSQITVMPSLVVFGSQMKEKHRGSTLWYHLIP